MLALGWPSPAAVKASASCWQDWPVKEECQGSEGTHQVAVATFSTLAHIAKASGGNSSTLATVASLGREPCWMDCFHMVAKSGGSGTLVKKSAPEDLKAAIIEE